MEGAGGICRGAGGRWRDLAGHRDDAPNQKTATRHHRCGGHRRAWLRCPWAAARPGRASRRRVELPNSDPAPQVWRTPEGAGGPGRGAGGWRQGQGGPRDRPLRAQLACGDLAGGPPPTGTHSGRTPQSSPARQVRPDGARNTRGGHKQPDPAAGSDGARNTRGARQRLRLGDLAARLAQGQAAVAVDGGTHVDEARTRQERRVGAGAKLADGVQAFGGEAPSELGHEVGH